MLIKNKGVLNAISKLCNTDSDTTLINFELAEVGREGRFVSVRSKFAGQNVIQLDIWFRPTSNESHERPSVLMERYLIQCSIRPVIVARLIGFEERGIIWDESLIMSERLNESTAIAVEGPSKFELADAVSYLSVRLEQAGLCAEPEMDRTERG